MSRREKLFDKLRNSPQNAAFADLRKLLQQDGFSLERIAGSHHVFKRGEITFVIPVHKNQVKSVYIKRVIELLEKSDYENRS